MFNPTNHDSTESIKQAIVKARPRIEQVNRIAGWSIPVYGMLYVLLGLALALEQATLGGKVTIINTLFDYQFWGAAFFTLGIILLAGFVLNSWETMHKGLAVGIAVQMIWVVALVYRFVASGYFNVYLLLLWSALTAVGFVIYLFFLPEVPASEKRLQEDEHHVVAHAL